MSKVVNNFYMHIFQKISFLVNFLCACVDLFQTLCRSIELQSVEQTPKKPMVTQRILRVTSLRLVTIFSFYWPLILLHHIRNGFSSTSSHVFHISAGFQQTLFPSVGQAGPLTPLCPQTDSRKFWIQATARFFVGDNDDY